MSRTMVTESLRRSTRALHERVERAVDLPARCAGVASYRDLLRRMMGLYEPLEELLSRFDWGPTGLDFEARRKVHLLRGDLRALGATEGELRAAPRCRALPPVATLAGALGCLYVLEGATLGGRIIARSLEGAHGITADSGGAFFAGHRERTGEMWRAFGEAANAHCGEDPAKIDAALAAAAATFEAFEAWLQGADGAEVPPRRAEAPAER